MKKKAISAEADTASIPLVYRIVPPCILAALAALVYYPSLHYAFQFDDIANITKHFNIRHHTLWKLFFSGPRWISYWVNSIHFKIGRFDPFSYRVGNVMFHIITGVIVFFVVLTALAGLKKESFFKQRALPIAFVSSLLFLLHPVQTQTVSYVIQGQLEGLAALFILSTVLCFLLLARAQNIIAQVLLTGLFFVCAAFSTGTKEIAIILPALLLLVDWFFVAQGEWQSLKKRLPLHAAVTLLIGGIYLQYLKPKFFTDILGFKITSTNNIGNVITQDPRSKITPFIFFISQFKVILHYLFMFLWPFNISVEYDWVLVKNLVALDCILPLLVLAALGYTIVRLLRRDPINMVAFGFLWFFMCIAPRSSIIPSPELLVDYKTYTASFGWLFLLAAGVVKLWEWLGTKNVSLGMLLQQRHGHLVAAMLLAFPMGLATVQRNTVWRSGTEFWANVIRNAPKKARAYNNYGVELSQNHKRYRESIPYFKKAISMDRNYPDPCNNLAVAYSTIGETDKAIEALKQGLRIQPYYPEGYNNLASFFLQKKMYEEAERSLKTALKLRPYYGKAFYNMGRLHLERGDKLKAWECFKNSCTKGDLDNDFGYSMYAKVSSMLKKYDDAIIGYTKALELNPNLPDGKFSLGNAYYLAGRHQEAIGVYEQLMKQKPSDTRIVYNLGEAYFKNREPEKALTCFKRVQPHKKQYPHITVKLAACYDCLGDQAQAEQLVQHALNDKSLPEEIRVFAQNMHNQYSARKGVRTA